MVFETAKSDFVTAFCNFHRDTSMRRCKYVKQCKTSQLLIQIEGDVSTHHSNDFVNPDFANVILSQPIPAQTINFIHTIANMVEEDMDFKKEWMLELGELINLDAGEIDFVQVL